MRLIELQIPRDVLQSLLDGKQANVPFVIQGDGEPLRIVLYAQQSKGIPPKFKPPRAERED